MAAAIGDAELARPTRSELNKLPPELRTMVWEFALPGPREIRIWRAHTKYDKHSKTSVRRYLETKPVHPSILSINRESREYALRKYAILLGPNKFCIAIDVFQDTIIFLSEYELKPTGLKKARNRLTVEEGDCTLAEYNPPHVLGVANRGTLRVVFTGLVPTGPRGYQLPEVRVELKRCTLAISNIEPDLAALFRSNWTYPVFYKTTAIWRVNWQGYDVPMTSEVVPSLPFIKVLDDPFCVKAFNPRWGLSSMVLRQRRSGKHTNKSVKKS